MQEKILKHMDLGLKVVLEYPNGVPDAEDLPMFGIGGMNEVATELAKLYESELARVIDKWRGHRDRELARADALEEELEKLGATCDNLEFDLSTVTAATQIDIATAQAQVAVMAQAAEQYIARITSGADPCCFATEQAEDELRNALSPVNVLWSGIAELNGGMLMGYMHGDKRIDAPDQFVDLLVLSKRQGEGDGKSKDSTATGQDL